MLQAKAKTHIVNHMKKTMLLLFLMIAVILSATIKLSAQSTFGGVTTSYATNFVVVVGPGVTNVPAYAGGVLLTNQLYLVPPAKTLTITNLTAGQTNVYGYFLQAEPLVTVGGLSNLLLLGYSTNIYTTSGTTNQTITPGGIVIPFPLYMSAQLLGAATNGFFAQ